MNREPHLIGKRRRDMEREKNAQRGMEREKNARYGIAGKKIEWN